MRRALPFASPLLAALLAAAAVAPASAESQFGSSGLGISAMQSNARGWGMGAVAYGLPDTLRISFANPSFAAGMREVSYSLLYAADRREVSGEQGSFRYNASTFPFFAFAVPFAGRYALGFGYDLEQDISTVRTNTGVTPASGEIPEYTRLFERKGGIFRVPGVAAVRLFRDVRVGFRLDSYFGNVDETYEIDFNDPDTKDAKETLEVGGSGTAVAFGISAPVGRIATIGAAWSAAVKLEGHRTRENENGQIRREEISVGFPERIAVGATLGPRKGWLATGEMVLSRWSDVEDTLVSPGGYDDVTDWAVGVERFVPGRRWYNRVPLRAGFRASSLSYLDGGGERIDRRSVTAGSGFRLGKGRGRCDWALEYGRIGDSAVNGLEESYWRIAVGVSGQEPWKRRKSYIE